jgi:autotransporter-associated beta strand protein
VAGLGLWQASSARATVLTPEQRADPSTGLISTDAYGNPLTDFISYQYYGSQNPYNNSITEALSPNTSTYGTLSGAVYPNKASVTWYKFNSDGTTPISIDMFGSNIALNPGGSFGATNDGSMAVFNNSGGFIASNQGAVAPATGDSNLAPTVSGSPPANAPLHNNRQPSDPTKPVGYIYDSTSNPGTYWYASNSQGLPILNFVNNPQTNPNLPSTDPNYSWNQYSILPAGTYFLAVTGYDTVYSGNPATAATLNSWHSEGYGGNTTSTTPFGYITLQTLSGVYEVNFRNTGDFNGDTAANLADLRLLRLHVAAYLPNGGFAPQGFNSSGKWVGLPADTSNLATDLQQYDLTGNGRIDANDIAAWGQFTNQSTIVSLTWNNSALPASDPENPGAAGDGVTWDLENSQNFNDTIGTDVFFNGDLVTFNDSNNGHYAVTLNGQVSPGSLTFSNSAANYVISGTGSINGSTGLLKSGSAGLTLSTVNTYTGGTNVSGGKLLLTVTGALPINSALTIGSGASVVAVNTSAGSKIVLQTNGLSIAGSSNAWTGLLDLNNNDLIAHNGSLGVITNQIKSGFAGGWTGTTGITSSAAASNTTHLTALGVIQNSTNGLPSGPAIYSTFDGASVSDTDVLVKYTYYGDTNLSASVDSADYSRTDNGFLTHAAGWFNGDFNYDSVVNGSDYTLIDNAFNTQGAAISAQFASSTSQIASASVPEPSVLSAGAVGAISLLARRRRPN